MHYMWFTEGQDLGFRSRCLKLNDYRKKGKKGNVVWDFLLNMYHHTGSIECTKNSGVKFRIFIVNVLLEMSAIGWIKFSSFFCFGIVFLFLYSKSSIFDLCM